ncbi:hypothetical protein L596_015909 [Steinernema carpocapsae]|uniref:Uncharacterized protein n=1 Tax=Steinernema carpocapsae TaxID=34508 RepID=A0A4U5NGI0_STECR|nr:hypothetical protein L596_015909 [Steinernema carpocapsae]
MEAAEEAEELRKKIDALERQNEELFEMVVGLHSAKVDTERDKLLKVEKENLELKLQTQNLQKVYRAVGERFGSLEPQTHIKPKREAASTPKESAFGFRLPTSFLEFVQGDDPFMF